MKKFILYFSLIYLVLPTAYAQLPRGANAYDFSVNDINGGSHSVYAKLAGGKSVILDFSATWCGPCWSLHQSGILESVHSGLSAFTSVLFLESDYATNVDCLYGWNTCSGGGTWGNWVAGSPYPICNLTSSNGSSAKGLYAINYFPTVYIISPDKRAWEIDDFSYAIFESWVKRSVTLSSTASTKNANCGSDGYVKLTVSGGEPPLSYKWSNGATTQDLTDVGSGAYSVTITDLNGYFVKYGPYTITGPAKQVNAINPSIKNNPCFSDAKGEIKVTPAYGTAPYTLEWSNGSTTATISNLAAGNYTLTVTDVNNCTGVTNYKVTQPDDLVTTVNVVDVTCSEQNGEVRFLTKGGTTPYNYTFEGRNPSTKNLVENVGLGNYQYTIIDNNKCRITGIATVSGTEIPVITAGKDRSLICTSDTLVLDGKGSETGRDMIYKWSTNNGKIIGDSSKLIVKLNKKGIYYLYGKNTKTSCEAYDTIKITDDRKFPDAVISGIDVLNCNNPSTTLKATTKSTNTLIYWRNITTNHRDTIKDLYIDRKGDYELNVVDTNTVCITRDTSVVREDKQAPSIAHEPINDINCKNSTVSINAELSDHGNDYIVKWTTPRGDVNNQLKIDNIADAGVYFLEITNQLNGCKSSQQFDIKKDITKPTVIIPVQKDILKCNGSTIQLDATGSSTGLAYDAVWMTKDGNIVSGVNGLYPVVDKAGTYTLEILNQVNFCLNQASTKVDLQDKLNAEFSLVQNKSDINVIDKTSGKVLTRKWTFGDGAEDTNSNANHTYAKSGNYDVCLTVTNDCGSHTNCNKVTISDVTGINQIADLQQFDVYPNPIVDMINIAIEFTTEKNYSIQLSNSIGQNLYNIHANKNKSKHQIPSAMLTTGVYYITLTADRSTIIRKIIIP